VLNGELTCQTLTALELNGMATTAPSPTDHQQNQKDERLSLVERIIGSQCLQGSARLREFLSYVAACVLRDAPEDATEQQIGINVFGRMAGYNSSEDSIVRTHARLLRQKLKEYFAGEGIDEPVLLEIPKGHYVPVFEPRRNIQEPVLRSELATSELEENSAAVAQPIPVQRERRFPRWAPVTSAVLGLALILGCWWLISMRASPMERFWKPFMADDSALVIYSNELFSGDSTSGLRYTVPHDLEGSADSSNYVYTYTGIGELAGVYELTKLFDSRHASFILKRSLLVTWDEAKLHNLIFLGSTAENPSLRDVRPATDFTITTANGYSGVVNHHPKPGEPRIYSVPMVGATDDYAILAYLPGVQPGKHMLIFSGLTTLGTQAAVDVSCHPETFNPILRAATNAKGEVRPFEAVIETSIRGGVPLETHLVALHVH
jgi:hypothetical protein